MQREATCPLGHINPTGARFCGECGAELDAAPDDEVAKTCPNGHALDFPSPFCPTCGAAVDPQPASSIDPVPVPVPPPPDDASSPLEEEPDRLEEEAVRTAAPSGRPRGVLVVGLVVVLALIGAWALIERASEEPDGEVATVEEDVQIPRLTAAARECASLSGRDAVTVSEDGSALVIDMQNEDDTEGFEQAVCVFVELETSEATIAKVDGTTALMGVRTADESGLHYEWTYHPDNGLDMVIEEA